MPRPSERATPLNLPADLDATQLPRFGTRKQLAQIHNHYFGPISPRTLEAWPLSWRLVNGRAVTEIQSFLDEAQKRFDAAPVVRGGRQSAVHHSAV